MVRAAQSLRPVRGSQVGRGRTTAFPPGGTMGAARRTWVAAALATLLAMGTASAQTDAKSGAGTGTVTGTVSDDAGAALSGAEVRVEGTTLHTSTDDKGHFEIAGVPAGPHSVRALMLGFKSALRQVTVEAGGSGADEVRAEKNGIPGPGIEGGVAARPRPTPPGELAGRGDGD